MKFTIQNYRFQILKSSPTSPKTTVGPMTPKRSSIARLPNLVGQGLLRRVFRTIFNLQSLIRSKGFTLLEVLISLAIVGLTLTVLIHSQLLSVRQGIKAKHHTTAVFLANEILSETFMREEPLLVIEGENFTDYPEFSWQREVEDSDIEGLKKIKITVSGPENTRIILNTYRLQSITVQTGTKK